MSHPSSSEFALRIQDVDTSFRGRLILRGIDLEVRPGEVVCLLGPSGCGKTTLLKVIAGLTKPDAGEVWINGLPQRNVPTNQRDLGFVFQQPTLFPTLDVWENLAFPFVKGRKKVPAEFSKWTEAVDDILRRARISGRERDSTVTLSGGEKQRVALARALVYRPTLLLLDEPMSAVDNALRSDLLQLLIDLHEQFNTTIIYVTHDEREALRVASRIAVMDIYGRIIHQGSTAQVVGQPRFPSVAKLLGGWNLFSTPTDAPDFHRRNILNGKWRDCHDGIPPQSHSLVGLPVFAVRILPEDQKPTDGEFHTRVSILSVGRAHGGWRYGVEIPSSDGSVELTMMCSSDHLPQVNPGEKGILTYREHLVYEFNAEPTSF